MIDLHCHVLPGLDDGPPTLDESVALCSAARQDGTRMIVATPHVNWDHPDVSVALIHAQVVAVNAALPAADVELNVRPGAEVALSRAAELSDSELAVVRLAGGPYVLIEVPWSAAATGVANALRAFASRGFGIVLAHPERTPVLQRNLGLLSELVDAGMLCCINARSLSEQSDRKRRAVAWTLLSQGLAHVIASDAHDAVRRPPQLQSALERAGLSDAQIDYFTRAAPEAIIQGAAVPPPPHVEQRQGRRRPRLSRS